MNERLLRYLRSIGLAQDATEEETQAFVRGLRGNQSVIANLLNYEQNDVAARTSCDAALRGLGFSPDNPNETYTPPAPSQNQPAGNDGASGLGDLERADAERERRERQIRHYAEISGASDELMRSLLLDGSVTADQARERLLDDHRERTRAAAPPNDAPPRVPAQHSHNTLTGQTRESLAAALMFRAGVADPTQQWCELSDGGTPERIRQLSSAENPDLYRAIEAGNRIRGYSLVNLVQRALALDGIIVEPTVASIVEGSRAMTSTGDFLGIFTQTFGAVLLRAFEEFPDTTTGWTIERDNPNFMQNERTRLKKGGALTKHARGTSADHMDYGDDTVNVKVNRYSGQFVIDEIDLQNDYFGALAGNLPEQIGQAARRVRPDLVYSILLANANFKGTPLFDASRNNLLTTNALDITGLQAAITAMHLQQENGVNLNLMGAWLIVPPSLRFTARELMGSAIVVTGSDVVRPNLNALSAEDLNMVSEARLENGVTDPDTGTTHAGSSSSWYLTAQPGSGHTVEVTYLAGSARAPNMRGFVLDKGQWGIGWDVKHDIGAAPLAFEGMNKSTA